MIRGDGGEAPLDETSDPKLLRGEPTRAMSQGKIAARRARCAARSIRMLGNRLMMER